MRAYSPDQAPPGRVCKSELTLLVLSLVLFASGCSGIVGSPSTPPLAGTLTLQVSTASLANGQVGAAYSAAVTATGGTTPYSWSVSSGSLPTGLSLAASTGQISGTPSTAGTFSFAIQVTDTSATRQTATKQYTVTVATTGSSPLQVSTASLANGHVGAAYSATLAATGGATPYSWSVSSGSLPTGLSLASSSGQISGTPSAAGTFSVTIQVKDSSATPQIATKPYSITIASSGPVPLQLITTSLANGQVSMPYSAALQASGGSTPYTWSVGSGALPAGLTLGASNGQISGTPTAAGSFPFTIQVKDSSSPAQMANQSFTVAIDVAGAGTPVTACGTLANAGTTYVLQNDVSSPGTCMTLTAAGITLNLNGHTLTYNAVAADGQYGITANPMGLTGLHITNGTIAQGLACGPGLCYQSRAVYIENLEADHLTISYQGDDNEAFRVPGGNRALIHDNTIRPNGTKRTLTHYGNFAAIYLAATGGNIAVVNNDIEGKGYIGIESDHGNPITGILEITGNTIKMAAPVRDGYGITLGSPNNDDINFEIANNTIIQASGRGIIVEGWTSSSSPGPGLGTVHDNIIDVREAANEGYSFGNGVGIQARFGAHNIQIYNNNITIHAGAGACPQQFPTDTGSNCTGNGIKLMGGTSAGNNQVYNNTINGTTNSTDPSLRATGLYADDVGDPGSSFHDNTVTTNSVLVDVSAPDGCGWNWLFRSNTFVKGANPLAFVSNHSAWFCNPGQTSTNNVFLDDHWQGGASVDDLSTGSNSYSYFVRSYLNVTVQNLLGNPVSGASVTATATGGGSETVNQTTDASGNAQLVLTDHSASSPSGAAPVITAYTPHTLTVTKTGCVATFSVSLQVAQSMNLPVSLNCP
jgi:Putative Ig domain